ncbi:MAG TPA: hypothetical protein VGE12_18525 [Noviherbaspirillum sp.]
METDTLAHVAFFLAGKRSGEHMDVGKGLDLRPALFAGYRDLATLRYDFPLVLVAGHDDGPCVQSLSGLIDATLEAVDTGNDGARIRKHVLRLEQEIRGLVAVHGAAPLSMLWDMAAGRLASGADASIADSLKRARAAIRIDGEVVDCDAALPARLLQHAWAAVQQRKTEAFCRYLDVTVLKLSDILKADYERSDMGRSAPHLKASVGSGFEQSFDFDAMSRILSNSLPKDQLPEVRRKRIRELLRVLTTQNFFPHPAAAIKQDLTAKPYCFLFDSCAAALAAFRGRMPALIELAKAIAIAELEIEGQYNEEKHDAVFEQFGANELDPEELAPFPDYLVCLNAGKMKLEEHAQLMEILSSPLPIKVLLQIDDILDESRTERGSFTTGMRSRHIANMTIGLNSVYVLQSSSSNLYKFRNQVKRGLAYRGPALFSVFSGASGAPSGVPPYLTAAAAMESRIFPAFTYDPAAGPDWASRFDLGANSQLERDWPVQCFSYEDQQHQRVTQEIAFTPADFIASDHRFSGDLARVEPTKCNGSVVAVDEFLSCEHKGLPDKVPHVLMIDGNDMLQKVIVGKRLIREARRCREMWHSLQELGGVHNSHARRLLERERKAWEAAQEFEVKAPAAPAVSQATATAAASAVAEQDPERTSDDAYIETPRCSTCEECVQINNRMFAYDGNKQAYIADIDAGTYAQLVEAAESCQVSIIHPGKPRNPNEPGLAELLKRAEPFM